MLGAGIDAGSRTIKVAVVERGSGRVTAQGVRDQGVGQAQRAEALLDEVLARAGLRRSEVQRVVATGYGRHALDLADERITEITCHACGVLHSQPGPLTLVDIGGQDSKAIWVGGDGRVLDFAMNDRCAAGTGSFLEVLAARLGVDLAALGALAAAGARPAAISSTCVVFAETEVIGLLAARESPANIVAGVQAALAERVARLAGGRAAAPVVLTGGVALIPGVAEALSRALGLPVRLAPSPQLTGALGAALLAARMA